MAGTDDPGFSLPPPPPPAPARREVAIEAALARFDGAPVTAAGRKKRLWRPLTHRPALGTALALSLIALVAVPVAWREMPRQKGSTFQTISRPPEGKAHTELVGVPAAPAEVRQEPPAPVSPVPEPLAAEPKPSAAAQAPEMPPLSVPSALERASPPPPPAALVQADRAMASAPVAVPAPPAPATAASGAFSANRARKAESEDAREIVVTSARMNPSLLRGRGDWNVCTVQDPERNLALCKKLVDPDAKGGEAQIAAGLSHAWKGDWEGAIAAFDKAIAIAPKSSQAYLNRGLAYQAQGDEDRALADLDKAIRYAPHTARGYYSRSLLQKQRGEEKKAAADRDRAAELDSRYEP